MAQDSRAFLHRVARHYYERYEGDILRLHFVFPSKRALLFFGRALGEIATKPIFAPPCSTINDFLMTLSPGVEVIDHTALLFELYDCFAELRGGSVESFDEFVFWGNIILKDFDLIDRQLIEYRHLYRNLEAYKEMQEDFSYLDDETLELIATFWKGFNNPNSQTDAEREDYRKNFMDFWLSLLPLYERFKARLKAKGFAYEGQMYRMIAEDARDIVDHLAGRLEQGAGEGGAVDKYVFVGLFDISKSEMKLLRAMSRRGIAEFYWDEEVAPAQDPKHPAYRILANNISELGRANTRVEGDPSDFLPSNIWVYKCSSTVAEVKALPKVLGQLGFTFDGAMGEAIDTAIILPNESLLLPVAGSIPSEYEYLNITLGYPLYRTPVAIMLSRWLRLLLSEQKGAYPLDRLQSILSLQLFLDFFPGLRHVSVALSRLRRHMLSARWILDKYLNTIDKRLMDAGDDQAQAELRDALPLLRLLLEPQRKAHQLLVSLTDLLDSLGERMLAQAQAETEGDGKEVEESKVKMSFDLEFVYHYRKLVARLVGLVGEHPHWQMSPETVVHLLESLGQSVNIPFEGNPLRGLQIMGLLESRLLSFETTVYLSAQEGQLPHKRNLSTLIPATLRKGFGLPMTEELDAIDAYRFYESIAHSKRLVMLYGLDDPLGAKGEESRYVAQMEMLYRANIQRCSVDYMLSPSRPRFEPVAKSRPDVAKALARYLVKGEDEKALSASSLAVYKSCSLAFYYQELLEVRAEQAPDALMPANDFGTILHDTMEMLYSRREGEGGTISQHYLASLLEKGNTEIDRLVTRQYQEHYKIEGESAQDLDPLARYYVELIIAYVRAVLRYDMAHAPFTYLAGEAKLSMSFPLSDGQRYVNIKGTIDRLDLANEGGMTYLRVLDYKTGSDQKPIEPTMARRWEAFSKNKAVLQTLLYSELLRRGTGKVSMRLASALQSASPILPGLLLLRQTIRNPEAFDPYIYQGKDKSAPLVYTDEVRAEYIESLQAELEDLFDPEGYFVQTEDVKACSYCPFVQICGR